VISRIYDAGLIQTHAELLVPEMLQGFDAYDWVADPGNIALSEDDNIVLYEAEKPGVYFAHWLFRSARGKMALELSERMLGAIFIDWKADTVYGLIPVWRRSARWATKQLRPAQQTIVHTPDGDQELTKWERSWAF
jgi:hypothetical protein